MLFDKIDAFDSDVLSNSERAELLERRQTWRRRLPAGDHELINHLATASADESGGTPSHVLADRLRITRAEARRRIDEATDLRPRRALTGEPLAPKLEHTAARQRAGLIGVDHVRIIRRFFAQLPHFVDEPTRADAECKRAEVASQYRPDEGFPKGGNISDLSGTSPWPADPTTASLKIAAGKRVSAKTVLPSGSRRRTWTEANAEPTRSSTPRAC